MDQESVKIIGGPAAGRTVTVEKGLRHLRLWEPKPMLMPVSIRAEVVPTFEPDPPLIYERMAVRGDAARLSVFVPEGWTGDDLINELLNGYRQGHPHA